MLRVNDYVNSTHRPVCRTKIKIHLVLKIFWVKVTGLRQKHREFCYDAAVAEAPKHGAKIVGPGLWHRSKHSIELSETKRKIKMEHSCVKQRGTFLTLGGGRLVR